MRSTVNVKVEKLNMYVHQCRLKGAWHLRLVISPLGAKLPPYGELCTLGVKLAPRGEDPLFAPPYFYICKLLESIHTWG
jgi:hypothetical protein